MRNPSRIGTVGKTTMLPPTFWIRRRRRMIFLSCWPDLHSSCSPCLICQWWEWHSSLSSCLPSRAAFSLHWQGGCTEAINAFSPLKKNQNKNGKLIMLNFIHTSIQCCVVQATGEVLAALVLHKCARCLNLANLSDRKNEDILDRQTVPEETFGSAFHRNPSLLPNRCGARTLHQWALRLHCLECRSAWNPRPPLTSSGWEGWSNADGRRLNICPACMSPNTHTHTQFICSH